MKLSAGVLQLQTGPADLAAIVREGVGASGLGDNRRVDLALDDVAMEGDRTQLVEVVRQVVQNAGEYSPSDEPITITLEPEGDDAVLTVADRGPGIPRTGANTCSRRSRTGARPDTRRCREPAWGCSSPRASWPNTGEISIEDGPGGGTMLRIRLPREGTERG